jgi:hypothetical protein
VRQQRQLPATRALAVRGFGCVQAGAQPPSPRRRSKRADAAAAVSPFDAFVPIFNEWDRATNRWESELPMPPRPVFGEMGVREGGHTQVPCSQQPRFCSVDVAPVVGCRPKDQAIPRYFPRGRRVDAGYVRHHGPCVRNAPRVVTLDDCCADRIVRLGLDAAQAASPVPWLLNARACGGGLHFRVSSRPLHYVWMLPARRCRRRRRDVVRR